MKQNKRHDEAFKLSVLEEIKSGKRASAGAAERAYGLRGSTIHSWMDQLGYVHLRKRVMAIKTPREASGNKKLKEEIRKPKSALADEALLRRIDGEVLKIVCGRLGTPPDEAKKKTGAQ